jgi:hypothetical protein
MPQTARLTAAGCRANRGIAPSQALNKAAPFGDEAEDDAEGEGKEDAEIEVRLRGVHSTPLGHRSSCKHQYLASAS